MISALLVLTFCAGISARIIPPGVVKVNDEQPQCAGVSTELSEDRTQTWNGGVRHDFQYEGRDAIVVEPQQAAKGRPWIWRPAFFDAFPSVDKALLEKNIFGGKDLSKDFPVLGQCAMYCVTEVHTKEDIDRLVSALGEIL